MNKLLIQVLAAVLCTHLQSQDLFMKTVGEVKGAPMMGNMGNSSTISYARKGQIRTETTMQGNTQVVLIEKDRVIITNPGLCGVFTKEELSKEGLDDNVNYKDVEVSLKDETKTLLGYTCKKAVINYKIVSVADYKYEAVYWYTNEIKSPDNSDLPSTSRTNDLFAELSKLGVVLLSETTMKMNGMKTITRVTEVNTDKIDDTVFAIKTKDCEKPKNLKEYNEELRRRRQNTHTGY